MRIAYCTNVRLPSERAHGHQIAQVCDALAHLGHDVTIFAPFRKNVITQDYWTYYGADKHVELTHVGNVDAIASKWTPGVMGLFVMNHLLRGALPRMLQKEGFDLLYTRTPALLPALLKTKIPTILELHQLPRRGRRAFVRACNRCMVVAALTTSMRDTLISWGVDPELAIAEGDAVDLRRFADLPPMPEARKQFTVKTERMVVGYVGRLKTLGMDKGVAVLLQALKALQPGKQFFGFIVGGPEGDRKEYEEMAKGLGLKVGLGVDADVGFIGEIPAAKVPASLAACDILAMPFPDFPHYRHHMSPLKMFEYMAANRTIVTTELPTVRDVLSEETAIFCKPGSVAGLAASLEWIRDHQKEARERAQKAYALVHTYTWEKRMQRILDNVPATVGA